MSKKKRKKKNAKIIPFRKELSPKNYIIKIARKLPIHEIRITSGFLELGTSNMLVSRRKKNGDLVVGYFKIDSFCVGLLESDFYFFDEGEYREYIDEMIEFFELDWPIIDSTYAFNFIYGAIEYGENNGFKPHKSFAVTQYILDDVEDIGYIDIEFGKDGRPLYTMIGPYNHKKNLSILDKTVGVNNYDIISDDGHYEEVEEMDLDMTMEEYIKTILTEEEQNNFMSYSMGLIVINELYEEKMDQLKIDYLNDPLIIIQQIEEHLSLDGKSIDFLEEDKAQLFWLSKIENYIIHKGYSFIFMHEMIDSFHIQGENSDNYGSVILSSLLHLNGQDKFDLILPLIGAMCCEAETRERMKTELRLLIQSCAENPQLLEDVHDLDYLEILIIQYFCLYEREFGEISFDSANWSIAFDE